MAREQKVYAVYVQGAFVVRAADAAEAFKTARLLVEAITDREPWAFESIVEEQLGRSSLRLSYPPVLVGNARKADGT